MELEGMLDIKYSSYLSLRTANPTNLVVPSEDSDQPAQPHSLIRISARYLH